MQLGRLLGIRGLIQSGRLKQEKDSEISKEITDYLFQLAEKDKQFRSACCEVICSLFDQVRTVNYHN